MFKEGLTIGNPKRFERLVVNAGKDAVRIVVIHVNERRIEDGLIALHEISGLLCRTLFIRDVVQGANDNGWMVMAISPKDRDGCLEDFLFVGFFFLRYSPFNHKRIRQQVTFLDVLYRFSECIEILAII